MRRVVRALAVGSVALAGLAGVGALAAGPGTRLGMWHFGVGFALLRWSAQAAAVAAGLALLTLVLALVTRQRSWATLALVGLVAGGVGFALPWQMRQQARGVPPIHDVTTDLDDPPAFVALAALRRGTPNGVDHGGPGVAALQRAGYPDIGPLDLPVPPPEALHRAEAAARRLGWTIVAVEPAEGRLEATATTPWFGFRDDVVVRVRPRDAGSRVDIRSVSRIGRSDLGANAARIRRFLDTLRAL